jgi:hypothetical protein
VLHALKTVILFLKARFETRPAKIYTCHARIADAARGMQQASGEPAVMTILWCLRQHY